jgi:formylglycine-generating enzyme required for sulfatase activity
MSIEVLRLARDILLPVVFGFGGVLLLIVAIGGDFKPLLRQPPARGGRVSALLGGLALVALSAGLYVVALRAENSAPAAALASQPSSTPQPTASPAAPTPSPDPPPTLTAATLPAAPAATAAADVISMDVRGHTLRLIPAGTFTMGGSDGALGEPPPLRVTVAQPFWIDIYEVTNRQYQACVDADACQPPLSPASATVPVYYHNSDFDYYPVVEVDWTMADVFCREWRAARLPTETEWEYAARGPDSLTYPWGDQSLTCMLANVQGGEGCARDTEPVTAYPSGISPFSVANLIGNVWEWTASPYGTSPTGAEYVLKGGGWDTPGQGIAASARVGKPSNLHANDTGFRCARSS